MLRARKVRAVGACLVVLVAAATPAAAHGAPAKPSEKRVRALEKRALGAEHAAEHARGRRAARRYRARVRRMGPRARRALARRERRRVRAAAAIAPSEGGSWAAPFPLRVHGIHAALLPTGKVMLWGYPFPVNDTDRKREESHAWLWDPAKGSAADAFEQVNPPAGANGLPAQVFCAGASFLADGRLLTTGGNLYWPDSTRPNWAGLNKVFTFNPWNGRWTKQPDMRHGRWYPSQELLPDGRTLILSGYDEGGNEDPNTDLEVFTPSADADGVGQVTHHASGDREAAIYPHLFTLPSGQVLLAGPTSDDAALLDTQAMTWAGLPEPEWRRTSNAVLQPDGPAGSSRVTLVGGTDPQNKDASGWSPARDTTESLDATGAGPAWAAGPKLNVPRSNHNTVLLPDGSMVAVGGSNGESPTQGKYHAWPDSRSRQVEIYDPLAKKWRLGPAQAEDRAYHSSALLLPDGRILSSGDDRPGMRTGDTGEIYSPPYLFKGARPSVARAPRAVDWATPFRISTTSPGISRAVLMAPGAVTHGAEMHAKHVELQVLARQDGSGLTVLSPPNANVAQPGWYMLFLLDDKGVPSVAHWVRLQAGADADEDGVLDKLDVCPELAGTGADGCLVVGPGGAAGGNTPAPTGGPAPQQKKSTSAPKVFGRAALVNALIPRAGAKVSRSRVVVLALENGNPFDVDAGATLEAVRPLGARNRGRRKLGAARAVIRARRRSAVKFRLSRRVARALARRRLTPVAVRLVLRDPRGNRRVVRRSFLLRPAARRSGSR